jgi:hypothetical protein
MLVACRLAGLSALETHYAGVKGRAQLRGRREMPRPSRRVRGVEFSASLGVMAGA